MSGEQTAVATLLCACKKKHSLEDPSAEGKLCGATTKQEGAKYPTCHRPSGWGTDHSGQGKYKLHGGVTVLLKSGRYRTMRTQRIRDLIEQQEQDADPLNIYPEMAATRALFIDYIDRYVENTDAMLAWHASFEAQRVPLPEEKVMAFEGVIREWEIALREKGEDATERQLAELSAANAFMNILRGKGAAGPATKPRTVLDISDAYRMLDSVAKMAEREWKRHEANAISRKDLNRVISAMGAEVLKYVTDEEVLKKIRHGWLSIAV